MRGPYSYRDDPAVPDFPDDAPIIIFDGHCVMCSAWARFVLRHDRSKRFRLLPAQTPLGEALYRHYGLSVTNYETNVLIEDGVGYFKSTGSIRMAQGLGFPWSLATVGLIVPRPLRDQLYEFIARNRFKWFGRQEVCYLVEPGDEGRFLK